MLIYRGNGVKTGKMRRKVKKNKLRKTCGGRKKALTLHRFWETTHGENEDIERITIDKK